MTSSTVSSDSATRQERGDPCGIDSYPAAVSSEHVEGKKKTGRPVDQANQKSHPKNNNKEDHDLERRHSLCSGIPEWLQEFRENLVDPERQFFSWTIFGAHTCVKCGFG